PRHPGRGAGGGGGARPPPQRGARVHRPRPPLRAGGPPARDRRAAGRRGAPPKIAGGRRRSGERRRHNKGREPFMTSSDTTSPIFITGATGRHGGTGAHLVRRLREAGRSVRALVRRLDERTEPLQALGAEIVV